jgi:hypothetical protein
MRLFIELEHMFAFVYQASIVWLSVPVSSHCLDIEEVWLPHANGVVSYSWILMVWPYFRWVWLETEGTTRAGLKLKFKSEGLRVETEEFLGVVAWFRSVDYRAVAVLDVICEVESRWTSWPVDCIFIAEISVKVNFEGVVLAVEAIVSNTRHTLKVQRRNHIWLDSWHQGNGCDGHHGDRNHMQAVLHWDHVLYLRILIT